MEKNKDSSRPLLYPFQSNFQMQEIIHKTLRDENELTEENSCEDDETFLNEEFFSAGLNMDEVVHKLRKMLGDKLTDEAKKELLTPWLETIGTMKTSSSLSENGEESLLEEHSMGGVQG